MKTLILYTSKTGFTKKYALWIAEEIKCDAFPFGTIPAPDIEKYDVILYGAGIYAEHISGLKKFLKLVKNYADQKIVVFATGAAPLTEETANRVKKNNFSETEAAQYDFFYFPSGLNYEKMKIGDKILMKIFNTFISMKNKPAQEEGYQEAVMKSFDNSKKEYTASLISSITSQ